MPEFKQRLAEVCLESGIEITELAEKCQISRSTLYGYIYYDTVPSTFHLMKLCECLKVSADYLIFGKGEKPVFKPQREKIERTDAEIKARKREYNRKFYYLHHSEMLERAKMYREKAKVMG